MFLTANPYDRLRAMVRNGIFAGISVLFFGCATQTFAPDVAPEYVVIRAYTPFYLLGPMQGGGPDGALPVDTRVKVLRKEMGYDLVLLEDKRTGYVPDENLSPAPPLPKPSANESDSASNSSSGKKRRGSSNGPRYTGEQLNDVPLPDPNVPPPDLNVAPEEVPASTPTPPPEKPKFRY